MTLDELKRVDLVALLTQKWDMTFTPSGSGFRACSPFRHETVPSFYVSMAEDGHWIYCDFSRGCSGSIIDLVMAWQQGVDFPRAYELACEWVGSCNLPPVSFVEPAQKQPACDWTWLHEKLCANDPSSCREYLLNRGLKSVLVDDLIKRGIVVLNRQDGNDYCCFAVHDAAGKLCSLFNRKMNGPAPREKFLLGRQSAFCLDWGRLASAGEIYFCESIIDALSLITVQPDAVVLALPGANFDLAQLAIPAQTPVIEAFDDDDAGRAAAARLRALRPANTVQSFDLQGAHDVNDFLRQQPADAPSSSLTPEDRLAICLDPDSSRTVAAKYNVHHSYVCKIRKEAYELFRNHWSNKRVGRPATPPPDKEQAILDAQLQEQTRRADFLSMRNDWLELQVKFHQKREMEETKNRPTNTRKKKARKKKGRRLK